MQQKLIINKLQSILDQMEQCSLCNGDEFINTLTGDSFRGMIETLLNEIQFKPSKVKVADKYKNIHEMLICDTVDYELYRNVNILDYNDHIVEFGRKGDHVSIRTTVNRQAFFEGATNIRRGFNDGN